MFCGFFNQTHHVIYICRYEAATCGHDHPKVNPKQPRQPALSILECHQLQADTREEASMSLSSTLHLPNSKHPKRKAPHSFVILHTPSLLLRGTRKNIFYDALAMLSTALAEALFHSLPPPPHLLLRAECY